MSGCQLTPQAVDDISDIWLHIANDNPRAADAVENAIHEACELLAKSPLAGRVRKDLTHLPVRFWFLPPYPNYVIVYDPATQPLRIIRVLHGARNIPSILR